jgi:hypothetical protein
MEFVNANQTSEQRRAKYLFLKMAGLIRELAERDK